MDLRNSPASDFLPRQSRDFFKGWVNLEKDAINGMTGLIVNNLVIGKGIR